MDTDDDSKYIMVPVPEERVPEVYAFLASAPATAEASPAEPSPAEPQAEPSPAEPQQAEPQAEIEWTDEEIRKAWPAEEIERAYKESSDNVRRILDYLAARPGQHVLLHELKTELGFTTEQLRGVMGGFGKRIAYQHDRKNWFFIAEAHPEKEWMSYIMSEYVANIIRAAD